MLPVIMTLIMCCLELLPVKNSRSAPAGLRQCAGKEHKDAGYGLLHSKVPSTVPL